MNLGRRCGVGLLLLPALAHVAWAQDASVTPELPPSAQQRITPAEQNDTDAILTTHPRPAAPVAVLPVSPPPAASPDVSMPDATPPMPPAAKPKPAATVPAPSPQPPAPFTSQAKPVNTGKAVLPANVPFGHASTPPPGSEIPSAPHTTVATPVSPVDAIEASEPAPPTPVAPGADPAAEDATEPTELTSPLFNESDTLNLPRKIVLRVLNKVTGQSTLFKAKPNEVLKFGRLEITAINCRVSAPNSQSDSAALLDIREHVPGTPTLKPLFHGWMYASSPSIAALEHPIYDVMMADCEISTLPKEETKPSKKSQKSKKK